MAKIDLPYVKWRDGRPRFEPGPRERAAGWKGQDLRHDNGGWFTLAEAHGWALARAAEIAAQRRAPKRLKAPSPRGRTVDDLIEDYLRSPKFLRLAPGTQADYRFKANAVRYQRRERQEPRSAGGATGKERIADDRVPTPLAMMPVAAVGKPEVRQFFEHLAATRGLVMARQTIMLLSAAWKWGTISSHWRLGGNPCSKIDLPKPKPRVVTWEIEEVRAFVAGADAAGEPELGDAVLLALFTGQRQGDVLAFTSAHVDRDAGVIRLVQHKTGTRVEIPLLAPLAARLAAMAARREAGGADACELVVDSRTGRGFRSKTFQHRFADRRTIVAAAMPSLGAKNFQDLRDTLLTWLHRAGADLKKIAGVSGHSMTSITQVLPHYVALGSADAADAMALLATWMDQKGMRV